MEVTNVARALYAYDSKNGMKFDAGELLNVFEKGEDGWWFGEVQQTNTEGWFPATYVSTLEQKIVHDNTLPPNWKAFQTDQEKPTMSIQSTEKEHGYFQLQTIMFQQLRQVEFHSC
ncbi:growth arrest-specific protein 7-like [Xenia sp. Carnegie-2017]|uniref:growth arrest-specific protein 7-like n=1 Tax=Xenia sp. Carnegie-2017 TaxID=2897299 RepID=UPI001F035E5F|nr:growth arrest-specific protein 7-like [Xenia sp. Carnegie-2017]